MPIKNIPRQLKVRHHLVSAGLCQHICLTVAFLAASWVPYGSTGSGIADKQRKEGNRQAEHNPQQAECVVKEPRQAAILQQNAPLLLRSNIRGRDMIGFHWFSIRISVRSFVLKGKQPGMRANRPLSRSETRDQTYLELSVGPDYPSNVSAVLHGRCSCYACST